MTELKIGTVVHLLDGPSAKVKKQLGQGGQGIVYLVDVSGREMALKWYFKSPSNEPNKFYENLRRNVKNGAPSAAFLWPQYVTQHEYGSFGYVMELRPKDHFEFGQFLLNHQHFASWTAMLNAAIEICEGFKALHAQGLSYQDLNDGNFFIHPQTGHVLICDNDNAFPNGEKSGVLGKARYMAPEVVLGKQLPNAFTDKFSLSVILFMLFYGGHPFEGTKTVSYPCMTEKYDKICYGSEILFVEDPQDRSNAPVKGIHNNIIRRWSALPRLLRDTFVEQFSKAVIEHPNKRLTEQQWLDRLTQVRDMLILCPKCGKETFAQTASNTTCMECGAAIAIPNTLSIDNRLIPLTDGNRIYMDRGAHVDLRVVHEKDASLLDLQNLTQKPIMVNTPSGKLIPVAPNDYLPVKAGLRLSIKANGATYNATIH